MQSNPASTPSTPTIDPQVMKLMNQQVALTRQVNGGASWFGFVGVFSLINSLAYLIFGGGITFLVGLGLTQLVDGVAKGLIKSGMSPDILSGVALLIDVAVAAVFVIFNIFGRRRQSWAFIIGMAVYVLDMLIFIVLIFVGSSSNKMGLILPAGFHVLALFGMFRGLMSVNKLAEVEGKLNNMTAPGSTPMP